MVVGKQMPLIGRLSVSLWLCALGAVVLYAFFVALASIPPAQMAELTAVVVALAALVTIRNLRVASELASRGGDPRLRRALNHQRERRGF